jgi:hypothetical protein
MRLAEAVALARRTRRIVRQNLGWAFAYNLLGHPAGDAGLDHALDGRHRHVGQFPAGGGQCAAPAARTDDGNLMEILYLLIPLSVLLVFLIGAVFWWSVKSGQFDDHG